MPTYRFRRIFTPVTFLACLFRVFIFGLPLWSIRLAVAGLITYPFRSRRHRRQHTLENR